MSSSQSFSLGKSGYTIDIEQGAETARLIELDALFTRCMGGVLPEIEDFSRIDSILDLACGPGEWALEMAFQCPNCEVVGVDINPTMIQYAVARAGVRKLDNASFEVMDILKPLSFADNSFDLVNARFLVAFMNQATWPQLLAECRRILKPGGILRMTECEGQISNSPAMQELYRGYFSILASQGRTFSVDGTTIGITYMLGRLLKEAGLELLQRRTFFVDASYGEELYESSVKQAEVLLPLLKPYMLHYGELKEPQIDDLYARMMIDMLSERFTCITFGLTAIGVKSL